MEGPDEFCVDSQSGDVGALRKPKRISLRNQMLLSGIFFATQLSIDFYSIYGMLGLQYFGLPTRLISMTSLISGVTSLTLIPTLGAYSDRGPRPKFRKAMLQGVGLCILLMGYSCIATAAGITSKDVIDADEIEHIINSSKPFSESNCLSVLSFPNQIEVDGNCTGRRENNTVPIRNSSTILPEVENSGTTIAGILGIIGLSCIDVSFDMTYALSKGLIVESVPARQKTQILNISTMLGGFAGCIMACVGIIDLPHYLGTYFNTDGMALTLILLCSCFSLVSILIFGTSTHTALSLHNKSKRLKFDKNKRNVNVNGDSLLQDDTNQHPDNYVIQQNRTVIYNDHRINNSDDSYTEKHSLKDLLEFCDDADQSKQVKIENGYSLTSVTVKTNDKQKKSCCVGYPRNRHFVLTVTACFVSLGCTLTGALFFSHTLTIEVYKGDPSARPGTPDRDNYEDGLRMASFGYLVSSIFYLLTSFVNTKLLKYFDNLLLLAFTSLLLTATVLIYYLIQSPLTFLFTMGAYGILRNMSHVVSYVIAFKYAFPKNHSKTDNSSDETVAPAGKITSLLGTMVPLQFLIMTFMGPAMELAGSSWLPMLYVMANGGLLAVLAIIIKIT